MVLGSDASALVTASAGKRLGYFFCIGDSSVMLDNSSNASLGMYDIRHL